MDQTVASAPPGLNPASLSGALAALYPAGVIAAELTLLPPGGLLTEDEQRVVNHCAEKRISEFTAGRLCARRALAEFGVANFSLLPAPDRQPVWPDALLGSITHTQGYSAAVVGQRERFRGLGVDCEIVAAVHAELWPRILTPVELERVLGMPVEERERVAALIFAAKEAFYKCQYPITGEWLEFEEIQIDTGDWGAELGGFRVRSLRPIRLAQSGHGDPEGRFRMHGAFVSCGVALRG